ncbi:hypothetical protein YC2023_037824 [Brassica napus]
MNYKFLSNMKSFYNFFFLKNSFYNFHKAILLHFKKIEASTYIDTSVDVKLINNAIKNSAIITHTKALTAIMKTFQTQPLPQFKPDQSWSMFKNSLTGFQITLKIKYLTNTATMNPPTNCRIFDIDKV